MIKIYEDNFSISKNLFMSINDMIINSNQNKNNKFKMLAKKIKDIEQKKNILKKKYNYKVNEIKHLKVYINQKEEEIANLYKKLSDTLS